MTAYTIRVGDAGQTVSVTDRSFASISEAREWAADNLADGEYTAEGGRIRVDVQDVDGVVVASWMMEVS